MRILLLLFVAAYADAAVTLVQLKECSGNGGSGTTSSASCSFASLPTVGNLVVVIGATGDGSAAGAAASDNQGNTYAFVHNNGGTGGGGISFTKVTVSAGTFTATIPGTANNGGPATIIAEFSGFSPTPSVHQQSYSNNTGGGSGSACSVTTTVGTFLVAMFAFTQNTNVGATMASPFPQVIPPGTSQVNPLKMGVSYLEAGSPATYTADFGLSPGFNMGQGTTVCLALSLAAPPSGRVQHRIRQ